MSPSATAPSCLGIMSGVEGGDWQTVSKKKGSRTRRAPRIESVTPGESQESRGDGADCQALMLKIHQAKEELRTSELWDLVQNTIQECFNTCLEQVKKNPAFTADELCVKTRLSGQPKPLLHDVAENDSDKRAEYFREDHHRSCVCYGIGTFSFDLISRHQLAFLLLVLEKLQIQNHHCHIYDPLFSGSEIEILKTLGFTVILENEEGKRRVVSPTIYYMVHCGKALYNNLLWQNWSMDDLSKMMIIGNSFQGFEERLLARVFQRDYAYISKVMKGTEEKPFPQTAQYAEIFNDTSIHWFPLQKLKGLKSDVWMLREEPVYDESESVEIIRNPKK